MIHFTVEGRGEFPFDMLRYDACYPVSAIDAGKMEHHVRERRTVDLVSDDRSTPTDERWQSFLWKVVKHKGD